MRQTHTRSAGIKLRYNLDIQTEEFIVSIIFSKRTHAHGDVVGSATLTLLARSFLPCRFIEHVLTVCRLREIKHQKYLWTWASIITGKNKIVDVAEYLNFQNTEPLRTWTGMDRIWVWGQFYCICVVYRDAISVSPESRNNPQCREAVREDSGVREMLQNFGNQISFQAWTNWILCSIGGEFSISDNWRYWKWSAALWCRQGWLWL